MSNGDIRDKIALLINCAGNARRAVAIYRAENKPSEAGRRLADARFYLRLAQDRIDQLDGAAS